MDTDVTGRSTCKDGAEEYESFIVGNFRYFQYDYRAPGGELFSCIAPNLKECRRRRDEWATKYLDKHPRERRQD